MLFDLKWIIMSEWNASHVHLYKWNLDKSRSFNAVDVALGNSRKKDFIMQECKIIIMQIHLDLNERSFTNTLWSRTLPKLEATYLKHCREII